MKRLFTFLLLILCLHLSAQTFKTPLDSLNKILPGEKMYIHTDRTMYSPGDDVWFKVYVVNGETFRPSGTSSSVAVELIDSKGSVVTQARIGLANGTAAGVFTLDKSTGGLYKIRSYTNWTGNFGEEHVFSKELIVQKIITPALLLKLEAERKSYNPGEKVNASFKATDLDNKAVTGNVEWKAYYKASAFAQGTATINAQGKAVISFLLPDTLNENDVFITAMAKSNGREESISRPVNIDINKPDIAFLPEGGDMVAGLPARIAFRALDRFGRPFDAEGTIVDSKGQTVASFRSLKFGMGSFEMIPAAGETYHALIKGNKNSYPLPPAKEKGIVLRCDLKGKEVHVALTADQTGDVKLIAQMHGKIVYSRMHRLTEGNNEIKLPVDTLQPGILQLTLFSSVGAPVSERLVFVNRDRTLKFDIQLDKQKYLPRDRVEVSITVKDENDKPVQGSFSLAVADEKIVNAADDKQDHILSALLLTQELKGKIEEPSFYFKDDEPLAAAALDLVMLTHGWRRYEWKQLLAHSPSDIRKNIMYKRDETGYWGRIVRTDDYYATSEKLKGIYVRPLGKSKGVYTDSTGSFFIPGELKTPVTLRVKKGVYSELLPNSEHYLLKRSTDIVWAPGKKSSFDKKVEIPQQVAPPQKIESTDLKVVLSDMAGVRYTQQGTFATESVQSLSLSEVVIVNGSYLTSTSSSYIYPSYGSPSYYGATAPYTYSWASPYYVQSVFSLNFISQSGYSSSHYGKAFYSPAYSPNNSQAHGDNRKTLYWNHDVNTDNKGKAKVEFHTADDLSSYRMIIEGISSAGKPGRAEELFYTEKALSIEAKLPQVLSTGDKVSVKMIIRNNTNIDRECKLNAVLPKCIHHDSAAYQFTVPANTYIVKEIKLGASSAAKEQDMLFTLASGELFDAIKAPVTVNTSGFENYTALSGNQKEHTSIVHISDPLDGSIMSDLVLYLNPFAELDNVLKSMIREPHGCFEQVTATNYPNILALQYLEHNNTADPEFTRQAMTHLASGYTKLANYETSQGGFEWYGSTPPHEALTAMGLLQFHEMKQVGVSIDSKLVERTISWLLDRREKDGGFKQNPGKYGFSGAPKEVASAYITWALTQMNVAGLDKEIALMERDVEKDFDFYKGALLANIFFKTGERTKGLAMLSKLSSHIKDKGFEKIVSGPTVTYSYGSSKNVECIALYCLAVSENKLNDLVPDLIKGLEFIYSQRRGGTFGNTQSTVLALKAIISSQQFLKPSGGSDGQLIVSINRQEVGTFGFSKSSPSNLVIDTLQKYFKKGKNIVSIRFKGIEQAPSWTMNVSWRSAMPLEKNNSIVQVTTSLPQSSVEAGNTARMNVEITNTTSQGIPQTVAIIGIPAGLQFDSHDLKRQKEEKLFDHYEIKDNYLVLYYAEMAPSAKLNIPLNLKAEIAGEYVAPASCAYLYYSSENKTWIPGASVKIGN